MRDFYRKIFSLFCFTLFCLEINANVLYSPWATFPLKATAEIINTSPFWSTFAIKISNVSMSPVELSQSQVLFDSPFELISSLMDVQNSGLSWCELIYSSNKDPKGYKNSLILNYRSDPWITSKLFPGKSFQITCEAMTSLSKAMIDSIQQSISIIPGGSAKTSTINLQAPQSPGKGSGSAASITIKGENNYRLDTTVPWGAK